MKLWEQKARKLEKQLEEFLGEPVISGSRKNSTFVWDLFLTIRSVYLFSVIFAILNSDVVRLGNRG